MEASEKWRLDRTTLRPEKVTVFPAGKDFVLVEGDDHTSYAGGFFDTPEQAFAHEIADAERSIRYGTDRKERVLKAQERFGQ